ncbi:MAG TPA: bifunctional diaminohydroxyphosphoribosylaminopyrimidine deaminase/5-amino-6-(5-phosphoribosylamino)uracil reductase RibD [Planctomycetota bacterium]|nr:bifunctional diaminohydroxyphosphoribosylaminopyrimidine deaminase/5-amino-6-(5-phosphoribosylamino)uracil reductase RibD [Planctomycetota bacterium]
MTDYEALMDEALTLAARGGTWVSPNPMVGAIVVKDGRVVGRGYHKEYGGRHAEVFALQEAGELSRGATLYCTLEPCNHFGKTPPCSQAVIAAGIKTVVLGALDPNPNAKGGIAALKAAGIEVITGIRERECRELNRAFFKRIRTGLPFITLKWAMSADGRIATAGGESKWITGEAAREHAHWLRGQHDAILVGIGTLLADGARLNCRAVGVPLRQPARVILDSSLRTPPDAPLFSARDAGPVIIACRASASAERMSALAQRGATFIADENLPSPSALPGVLKELAHRGIQSVLVEGGSRVLGSFIDARLCDAVEIFIGARLLGGAAALGPVGGSGIGKLGDALLLGDIRVTTAGTDAVLSGRCGSWDWLQTSS